MIRESLIDHVPIPARFVHPMPVMADDAADQYAALLRRHVDQTRLDFVLLGMGADAHTASLFPGSPALAVSDRLVAANQGPAVTPPDRLTMTYPLLNVARTLAVLVTGANKAATLGRVAQQMRDGGPDRESLPITEVSPDAGNLTWYLDPAAAAL